MEDPFIINQGRPASRYFTIAVSHPGGSPAIGRRVVCRNLKDNTQVKAICLDYFTFLWAEVPESFCLLNYGVNSLKLKNALEDKFPDFRGKDYVRFLLLEAI